eukprot:2896205-Prymnesium_polylepis.1
MDPEAAKLYANIPGMAQQDEDTLEVKDWVIALPDARLKPVGCWSSLCIAGAGARLAAPSAPSRPCGGASLHRAPGDGHARRRVALLGGRASRHARQWLAAVCVPSLSAHARAPAQTRRACSRCRRSCCRYSSMRARAPFAPRTGCWRITETCGRATRSFRTCPICPSARHARGASRSARRPRRSPRAVPR